MTIHNFEVSRFRSLDDFVDESYVLSLENEATKFSLCKRQGLRFGIDLTRWIAVDGQSAEILEDWNEYMKKPWSNLDNRLGRKAIDKPGAWGYLLTMKSIFQMRFLKDMAQLQYSMTISSYPIHSITVFKTN